MAAVTSIVPIMIMCSNGFIPIMRGFIAKSFYFDGEPMATVICYTLGRDNPYESETYAVEAKGNEVGKCEPGHGIISIALFVEEDKTLQKFELTCAKLKAEVLDSGKISEVKNMGQELDCNFQNVMSGLEIKRDGEGYIVTAHCQKLKQPMQGPPTFG